MPSVRKARGARSLQASASTPGPGQVRPLPRLIFLTREMGMPSVPDLLTALVAVRIRWGREGALM